MIWRIGRETGMRLRMGFSVALVVVLFGLWMLSAKPSCLAGYHASLSSATTWRCAPD
jgi:uncharacterized membrane protein